MADYSSTNIPAPKDWQAFERKIRLLFEHSLGDPHTQNNGRIGQPQHGVDVYGRRGGPSGHYVGVQCKGKDANYGGSVDPPPLKWSDLRYVFDIKEDCNGKEAIQA
jgi:hypothetical protein